MLGWRAITLAVCANLHTNKHPRNNFDFKVNSCVFYIHRILSSSPKNIKRSIKYIPFLNFNIRTYLSRPPGYSFFIDFGSSHPFFLPNLLNLIQLTSFLTHAYTIHVARKSTVPLRYDIVIVVGLNVR